MKTTLAFVVCLFMCTATFGQQGRVKKYTTEKCGEVVVADLPDKYNAHVYSKEMPDPDAGPDEERLEAIKEQIQKQYPRYRSNKRTSSTVLPPVININYVADSLSGIPPDNYTAISDSNVEISVMNDYFTIHNAVTGNILYRKVLEVFSLPVGLNSRNDYRYDPKVVYDPSADRFICIMLNGTNQYNYIVMGFSKTNDPTGGWSFYKFIGDYAADTTWFDYPQISITQNEVFFTGNKIKYDSSWQAGFKESVIYQIKKEDGYSGASSLTYQIWDSIQYNNQHLRCLYPLNAGNALQGPSQYFLSNRDFDVTNDSVFLVKVPDTIGSNDTVLTVVPVVSTTAYGVPPDARQPDTSYTLATNDGRVLGGFIAGNQVQFVSTSVDPGNGSSAVYLGVINNFNTSPTLTGQLFSIDTLDIGYPNISYAGNTGGANQAIISFDYSGPNTYPGYGAIFFDGSGLSPMLNIKSGDSSIYELAGKEQRWGDYSGSQPQWNTTGVIWVEGIFGKSNHTYGNYLAQLESPFFTGVPSLTAPSLAASNIYPNPSWEYISYEFTVVDEQSFTFVIYDAQGRPVDKLINKFCNAGTNVLQFNIAPLPPGTYFIKATDDKGENIAVHTFVRR